MLNVPLTVLKRQTFCLYSNASNSDALRNKTSARKENQTKQICTDGCQDGSETVSHDCTVGLEEEEDRYRKNNWEGFLRLESKQRKSRQSCCADEYTSMNACMRTHMTWNDMTWQNMTRHDTTRRDMAWHGMTWHDMTWHGTWHDVTAHDMTWHITTSYHMTWHHVTWHEMTWNDQTWNEMTWHDMRNIRTYKTCLNT